MSKAWSGGSTRAWRRVRAAVLAANRARNGGWCNLAIPTLCTGPATQVHHPFGKAAGDNPRHLVATCKACNLHVGDPLTHDPNCELCCATREKSVTHRVMTQW